MATKLRLLSNKWIRGNIGKKHFGVVLNLGCGNDDDKKRGIYSNYFTCDKLIKIDTAIRYKAVNCVAVAEYLPLKSKCIDFLFMNWVFYKTDMGKCLDELKRVLKKGSRVLITYSDVEGYPIYKQAKFIRCVLENEFDINSFFELDYVLAGTKRRAEGIYGTF